VAVSQPTSTNYRWLLNAYNPEFYIHSKLRGLVGHEPELLFTHRLKLGFIHPPRLPGDVNRFFRSRTERHRCTPDRFTDRFVTVSTASTPSYRCNYHHLDGSLVSRPLMDPPHKWESWNHQCTARPKNGAHPGKAIYIQLIGSCAVTNRHTSEAQSPAPGTRQGGIFWRDGRDLGVGYWVFLFVFGYFSIFLFLFLRVAACLCVCFFFFFFWLCNFVFTQPFFY
jgi:hypothetical protein